VDGGKLGDINVVVVVGFEMDMSEKLGFRVSSSKEHDIVFGDSLLRENEGWSRRSVVGDMFDNF